MSFIVRSILLVGCVMSFAVQGCMTTTRPADNVVLERSELGRPKWVSDPADIEPLHERWFVFEKHDLIRLDLGIRQAQTAALSAHCQLIAERMRFEIEGVRDELLAQRKKVATDKSKESGSGAAWAGVSPEGQKAINGVLEQLAQSQDCPELELKDVYWEKLRKSSPDGPVASYSIYVLLRLKLIPFDETLAMTAESLKLSGQADVQPLAEALRGRMSNSTQRGTNE
ncbi:MAG: hypothetical protein RIR26_1183 [Pseudomonadota bacterium]|jgi:hypothetical protein